MVHLHDIDGVEALRRELRLDPIHLARLRRAFFKNRRDPAEALAEVPEPARTRLAAAIRFHELRLTEAVDSKIDGATKLLFRTADELRIETVILRVRTGRTALCVSSQVGCGAACGFCATGRLGLRRNLSAAEILDQVVQANARLRDEGREVRNIVFMGMGEPLHNESALHESLRVLASPQCFHRTLRQVSVSTVGIPAAMVRCAELFPAVRIALSLHSAIQETRERLIPLARRHSLSDLREAVAAINRIQGHRVMIEHLLLDGINDGAHDLEALAEWAAGLSVHINLIPYNPIAEAEALRATPRPRREAFANELKARGFPVTLRYSLGADVTAACGQLVRAENRRA